MGEEQIPPRVDGRIRPRSTSRSQSMSIVNIRQRRLRANYFAGNFNDIWPMIYFRYALKDYQIKQKGLERTQLHIPLRAFQKRSVISL